MLSLGDFLWIELSCRKLKLPRGFFSGWYRSHRKLQLAVSTKHQATQKKRLPTFQEDNEGTLLSSASTYSLLHCTGEKHLATLICLLSCTNTSAMRVRPLRPIEMPHKLEHDCKSLLGLLCCSWTRPSEISWTSSLQVPQTMQEYGTLSLTVHAYLGSLHLYSRN